MIKHNRSQQLHGLAFCTKRPARSTSKSTGMHCTKFSNKATQVVDTFATIGSCTTAYVEGPSSWRCIGKPVDVLDEGQTDGHAYFL